MLRVSANIFSGCNYDLTLKQKAVFSAIYCTIFWKQPFPQIEKFVTFLILLVTLNSSGDANIMSIYSLRYNHAHRV